MTDPVTRQYWWEKKHERRINSLKRKLSALVQEELPEGYGLVGFALAREDEAEGCFVSCIKPANDIWVMDVLGDVNGDTERAYQKCFGEDKQ